MEMTTKIKEYEVYNLTNDERTLSEKIVVERIQEIDVDNDINFDHYHIYREIHDNVNGNDKIFLDLSSTRTIALQKAKYFVKAYKLL